MGLCADGTNALHVDSAASEPVREASLPPEPERAAAAATASDTPPESDAAPEQDEPDRELRDLVRELNIDETLDLVRTGMFSAAEVLAAENVEQRRKGVREALSTRSRPADTEE